MNKKKCCPNFDKLKNLIRSYLDKNIYILDFEKILNLKYGELQKCKTCNTIWYSENEEIYSDLINENLFKRILEWNQRNLILQSKFLDVLILIGKTPSALNKHILIPCKCALKNGKVLDYCILNIQKKPPLRQKNYENLIFIDQVEKIEASEFCLPLVVRIETTKKGYYEEVDEYDPTIIEDKNGTTYYIEYGTNLFYEENVKGSEMKLMSYNSKILKRNPKFQKNKIIETQVIADWTDEIENLFN